VTLFLILFRFFTTLEVGQNSDETKMVINENYPIGVVEEGTGYFDQCI
jgi:hypothetical protein